VNCGHVQQKKGLGQTMTKNYYLAVWGVGGEISRKDAAKQYTLFATQLPSGRFNESVYRFYFELVRHYPDIEMMTDEEMESSPWACALEVGEDYVIMALLEEWYADAFPLILNLAGVHGLICYDPQKARVHLPAPSRLKAAV
jgi:hypothetical protein